MTAGFADIWVDLFNLNMTVCGGGGGGGSGGVDCADVASWRDGSALEEGNKKILYFVRLLANQNRTARTAILGIVLQ